jgi:hypothetical protein
VYSIIIVTLFLCLVACIPNFVNLWLHGKWSIKMVPVCESKHPTKGINCGLPKGHHGRHQSGVRVETWGDSPARPTMTAVSPEPTTSAQSNESQPVDPDAEGCCDNDPFPHKNMQFQAPDSGQRMHFCVNWSPESYGRRLNRRLKEIGVIREPDNKT